MNARTTALSALIACRRQGAWADGALKEYIARDRLDRRDAALATRLVYGVVQNRLLLDFWLERLVKGGTGRLQPVVLDILRLGLYQITQLDKIPPSAAVNEAVEQGKKYASRQAAGLINGVLRSALRQRDALTPPEDLAIRFSHPRPLVELLEAQVGAGELEALLESHNQLPPLTVQRNPLAVSEADFRRELADAGVEATPHPWCRDSWLLQGSGSLEALPLFRRGGFYVQDPAARLAVTAAGLEPGMQVLDVCAAPGGKSFAAAMDLGGEGSVLSCDIHPHKIALLERGAARLGLPNLTARLQDATAFAPELAGQMDAVLADVPCSGLGVIRKKPDIRYKDLAPLARLPELQRRILDNVSRYVRPGGVLLYSTCTMLRRENEAVAEAFLADHPEYSPEPFPLPEALGGEHRAMVTLYPHRHGTDGFFICKLRRTT